MQRRMTAIIVLGAGMVGSAIARDLCVHYHVTVADIDANRLHALQADHPLTTIVCDLSNPTAVREIVRDGDLVIGAVPGFLGFQVLRAVIEAGKNVVDISFFDEEPFDLDELARTHGVTAVIDCGVAPGMGNIILGHHATHMTVEHFDCMVGGLPVQRTWPYQYKAPFSPSDVIEEYTRPARQMINGRIAIKPALSEPEMVDFEPVGTLEAFNTDGLRTLLRTVPVPNMTEKTLRYPGHRELMHVLRETGFFSQEPLDVAGSRIRPRDLTARLLFERWRYAAGEPDFTVARIAVSGQENGEPRRYLYHLFDRYDETTDTSSMARVTGYTCTAVARLILDGHFRQPGICPPEYVGATPGCFAQIMAYLHARGVEYTCERT